MAIGVSSTVKLFFHDKRFTVGLLFVWMFVTCTIFSFLGAFHNQFMTLGPSENTVFMAMKINTWHKWYALATFSMLNTTVNEFIASSLVPWFQNTIQDQKTRYLDHSKQMCLFISIVFDIYSHVMGIFGLYLMFSQIDFLLIRMMADIVVTTFTTLEWMKNKEVDKVLHDREGCLGTFNTPVITADGAGNATPPVAAAVSRPATGAGIDPQRAYCLEVFGTEDECLRPRDEEAEPPRSTGKYFVSFCLDGNARCSPAEEEQGPLLRCTGVAERGSAKLPGNSLLCAVSALARALVSGTAARGGSGFSRLRDKAGGGGVGSMQEEEEEFLEDEGRKRRRDPDLVIVFDASRH